MQQDAAVSFAVAPLTLFAPSPTNPRKRISTAEIADLAEKIAPVGVMQPVLARPNPDAAPGAAPMQLVFGQRRMLACELLTEQGRNPHGLGIPYMLRELTDEQVLVMQLLENIGRSDLHPLDEAEHYQRMRLAQGGRTVAEIALLAKVPLSRVYERLSLLDLVPAAREAFGADKLSLNTALQVARMPAAVQAEIADHLGNWGGEPMGPKAAAQFVRDRYMLRLSIAPFDPKDEGLVPTAGACGACPKRTGASPQLFGDIDDGDICTDVACYNAKKATQRERQVAELRNSGFTVLQGEEAREVCTPDGRHLHAGWHSLDAEVPLSLATEPGLKVVDVMTRAEAPNAHTAMVDHPNAALVNYAVPTHHLEAALRKLKLHRSQVQPASKPVAKTATQRVAEPPAPKPSTKRAANAQAAFAEEGETDVATPGEAAADALPGPSDDDIEDLASFHVPALSGGRYNGQSADAYASSQTARVAAILSAGRMVQHMANDGSEGLPSYGLAQLVIVALLNGGEAYLGLSAAARLCGITPPRTQSASRVQTMPSGCLAWTPSPPTAWPWCCWHCKTE